jgi:hypothetical protein
VSVSEQILVGTESGYCVSVRADTCWLGIGIMCQWGATCLLF